MRLNIALKFEFGNPPQVFAQDFFFDLELMLVAGMLVIASTAATEVRARRRYAVLGRFQNCSGVRPGEAGFLFGKRRFYLLSGKNKRNEHSLTASSIASVKASESVAAVDHLFNI